MSFDYVMKLLIVGPLDSGKTSVLRRFVDKKFSLNTGSTLGNDCRTYNIKLEDKNVKLEIWKTCGLTDKKRQISRNLYSDSVIAFVIYDITERKNFEELGYWVEEVKNYSHSNTDIVLIGNKSDLESRRKVTKQEGELFAAKHGLMFFETSAKSGENVDKAFLDAAKMAFHKFIRLRFGLKGNRIVPHININEETKKILNLTHELNASKEQCATDEINKLRLSASEFQLKLEENREAIENMEKERADYKESLSVYEQKVHQLNENISALKISVSNYEEITRLQKQEICELKNIDQERMTIFCSLESNLRKSCETKDVEIQSLRKRIDYLESLISCDDCKERLATFKLLCRHGFCDKCYEKVTECTLCNTDQN